MLIVIHLLALAEQQYLSDLQSVADDIRGLLACVADVQHAASRQYVKDSIVRITKAILEANSLVDEFLNWSHCLYALCVFESGYWVTSRITPIDNAP
jgi:hypothetical protein